MKKRLFLLPLLIGMLASCGEEKPEPTPGPEPEPTVHVESVSLSETSKVIEEGDTFLLNSTVLPENASNKNVTWSSNNEEVAKVSEGEVKAIKAGNAVITVKTVDQEKTATCSVEVKTKGSIIHVSSVSLNIEEAALTVGDEIKATATVLPENALDKSITWESEDDTVATVKDGTIKGVAEGTTTVNVVTNDGNHRASIEVTVSAVPPVPPEPEDETKTASLISKGYSTKQIQPLPVIEVEEASFTWTQNDGAYAPGYFLGGSSSNPSFKLYAKNTVVISSSKGPIKSIEFTYNSNTTKGLPLVADKGEMNADCTKWTGRENSVTLLSDGESGNNSFTRIDVTYVTNPQHDPVDLGVKSVKEVKDYIANAVSEESMSVNKYGMGVDGRTTVTIKGYALSKLNMVKTADKYGYNLSEPSKVVIGDDTDAIAVATKVGDGTLYGKVGSYQMQDTSRYTVTGYISMYLGNPELVCTSFKWDKTLDVKLDIDKISKGNLTIASFTKAAQNLDYNISGYGYGETYTVKGLTCYYSEADGQGRTWYNFTDGTKNIRVNAYNLARISVGKAYDVTGVISLAKYSPIIVAYKFKESSVTPVNLDEFYKSASEMSIENLKKINYVNDTETKYPEMIENYSKIYKATGYITTVEEGGKYYLSISDSYINTKDFPNGKAAASVKYNLALIKNDNFWNLYDPYFQYNPYLEETDADVKVTVYYTPRQTEFKDGKMFWEILLVPQSIPTDK